ncbi:hypothetical protein [Rhizobium sp. BK456]|uniref:hypothetical protein n=1 Tax=Rhizobium sp. BK456 TaxID=2587007 RepID=UPI0016109A1B|nr:hypothetical protein [Rhizobium sp. BK456]MBB3527584.1 hypothetical protein [Rhizobium sp. BK456]
MSARSDKDPIQRPALSSAGKRTRLNAGRIALILIGTVGVGRHPPSVPSRHGHSADIPGDLRRVGARDLSGHLAIADPWRQLCLQFRTVDEAGFAYTIKL